MAQDPRTIVRSSSMLWGDQVGLIEAENAMDYAGVGQAGIAALEIRLPYVIYEFYGGRRRFRDPLWYGQPGQ